MAKFRNQANGYVEEASWGGAFLGALFFGLIYFAIKGLWKHSIAILLMGTFFIAAMGPIGFFLLCIMWVIYAFLAPSLVEKNYLERGWALLEEGETSTSGQQVLDEKICPDCAETIKAAASKCRFCGHIFTQAI